jgi:hypothetical protein
MGNPDDDKVEDGPQPPPSEDDDRRSREAWEEWAAAIKEPGEARERADG